MPGDVANPSHFGGRSVAAVRQDLADEKLCYLMSGVDDAIAWFEESGVRARHDAIFDALVIKSRGVVLDHAGNGVLAAFAQGGDPIGCALQAQLALADAFPALAQSPCVAIAVHADSGVGVDQRAINRTARMLAVAQGGQILVSAQARDAGSVPAEVTFIDHGECWLKDLRAPLHLYSLRHVALRAPPLRLASTGQNSGIPRGAGLFGRDADVLQLLALAEEGQRLISIVGPGGIGKTRLASHVGALLGRTRPAHFVTFEELGAAIDLAAEISSALNIRTFSSGAPEEVLCGYLRDRNCVIVLDGAEHVLDQVSLISRIVEECSRVTLLVTTREPLKVAGESLLRLVGLETPATDDDVPESAAYALFLANAQQNAHSFALSAEDRADFRALCDLLAGSPLALHLAAQCVRYETVGALVSRVRENTDALVRLHGPGIARHSNMRAVFEGSWALLEPEARAALARLSVFWGGADWRAAEQVAGVQAEMLHALEVRGLIDRVGRRRLRLHPLVQSYVAEKLDPQERRDLEQRHAAYYFAFLKSRMRGGDLRRHGLRLDAIQHEFANIRQAWSNSLSNGAPPWDVLEPLFFMTALRSLFAEAEAMFSERSGDADFDRYLDALRANCAVHQGRVEAGFALAASLAKSEHPPIVRAHIEQTLANAFHMRRDVAQAIAHYRRAHDIRHSINDRVGMSYSAGALSIAYQQMGNLADAEALAEENGALSAEVGNTAGAMVVYGVLADVALARDDRDAARDALDRGLALEPFARNPQSRCGLLLRRCDVHMQADALDRALADAAEAVQISSDLGAQSLMVRAQLHMGRVLLLQGKQAESARESFSRALRTSLGAGIESLALSAVFGIARAAEMRGDISTARKLADTLSYFDLSSEAGEFIRFRAKLAHTDHDVPRAQSTSVAQLGKSVLDQIDAEALRIGG